MTNIYFKLLILLVCFFIAISHSVGQCAATPPDQYIQKFKKRPNGSKKPPENAEEEDGGGVRKKSPLPKPPYQYSNQCFSLRLYFILGKKYNFEQSLEKFQEALKYINDRFRGANIEYVIDASIHLDIPEFYTVNSKNDYLLQKLCQGQRYDKHFINIYIVEKIYYGVEDEAKEGYAMFPNDPLNLNAIFIRIANVDNGTTISHELGHFFGLLHTFENFEQKGVIGDDDMDDTNEDPRDLVKALGFDFCKSNILNHGGKNYYLPVNNIMSYYDCSDETLKHFSPEQLKYMRYVSMTARRKLKKTKSKHSKITWESASIDDLISHSFYTSKDRTKALIFIANEQITWCNRKLSEMDNDPIISELLSKKFFPIVIYPQKMTMRMMNDFLGNIIFQKHNMAQKTDLINKYLHPDFAFYPAFLIIDLTSGKYRVLKFIDKYMSPNEMITLLQNISREETAATTVTKRD